MYNSILIAAVCTGLVCIAACISKPAAKSNVREQNTPLYATGDTLSLVQPAGDDNPGVDGEMKRLMTKRGNVGALAIKEGKMVVLICVNQSGKVISAQFDPEKSSPKLAKYARLAEETAKEYEFEANYTAPLEECGQMTFVFKFK